MVLLESLEIVQPRFRKCNIYRKNQNCAPDISVARFKLSKLGSDQYH